MAAAILLWSPVMLHAQNENETPEEEIADQVTSEEAESEAQETGQEESGQSEPMEIETEEPPGRFIPSEEISEDKSVAFPVDI
jgi:hypothetical protein